MSASLVSIIVPVYNTVEYVEECIQSVLSQSYKNTELILVNDGSTDGSAERCQRYASWSNVHYLEQENCGATAARKRGVDIAKGDWIMFVDSDDVISKDAVSVFLSESNDVDIVVGRLSNRSPALPEIITRDDYLYLMYAKTVSSSPCAKLFHKRLFSSMSLCFPREVCRWEDWLMNLQIAKDNTLPVKTISECVYSYRTRNNSTSHSYVLSFDELEDLCKIADGIVQNDRSFSSNYVNAKVKNRLLLFHHELVLNGFHNEPLHPFVRDVKCCLYEAKVWRPLEWLLLSASLQPVVRTLMNVRKVGMRIRHPSMIVQDLKRVKTKLLKV